MYSSEWGLKKKSEGLRGRVYFDEDGQRILCKVCMRYVYMDMNL